MVVIEGEDAAPEAMRPSVAMLERFVPDIEWIHPPVGDRGIAECGSVFPEEAKEAIDDSDATFFGSTSGKSAAALFYLRWGKQTYANVRPARFVPGYRSPLVRPEGVDFVIVRENLEDLYLGAEGPIEDLAPIAPMSRTARAPIVDRLALVAALTQRRIAGAALDVFDEEPLPPDDPLRRVERLLLTPHIGYVTRQTYEVFYGETLEAILAFLAGTPIRVMEPS